MKVVVGYGDKYRGSAWVPVRVYLHNRTATSIAGTAQLSGQNGGPSYAGPAAPYKAVYGQPVILPGGSIKEVTLYVPGYDIESPLEVQLTVAGRTVSSATDYPTALDDHTLTLGAVTADPINVDWLNTLNGPNSPPVALTHLTPSSLDREAKALAGFDVIVLSQADTSQLDAGQWSALAGYVRDGGALLLVGGPDWQETLRPVPPGLLPGRLTGSTTLPNLAGLSQLAEAAPARAGSWWHAPTTVSVLANPSGTVLAAQRYRGPERSSGDPLGVPLVVARHLGAGQILYLAFDPQPGTPPAEPAQDSRLFWHLIATAAPGAVSRVSQPSGMSPPPSVNGGGFYDMAAELANVPVAALPSLVLFIALTVFYILVLGPVNFLVLARLRRRELAWITVPAVALLCMASTFVVAYELKGNTVLLNVAGIVTLDPDQPISDGDNPQPATFYVGLFAPLRGDYRLSSSSSALMESLPTFGGFGPGGNGAVGLRLQEGPQAQAQFVSMNMWSMRSVAVHMTVHLAGRLEAKLHLDAAGAIVGSIHNGTAVDLIQPAILTGGTATRLSDLPSGATIRVHVKPAADVHAQEPQPLASALFGSPPPGSNGGGFNGGGSYTTGPFVSGTVVYPRFHGPVGSFYCCPSSAPAPENSLRDRMRNVAASLPDAQALPASAETVFVAWSEAPLSQFSVEGASPRRRDLTLLAMPLTVDLSPGQFELRPGVLGAHLVDETSSSGMSNCCTPGLQPIYLGAGGSATFEFDIPNAGRVRFQRLALSADAGGADGSDIASVYDWRPGRWVHVDLSTGQAALPSPDRFIGPTGVLLVRLARTATSGDITIQNPYQNLQLSGSGMVAAGPRGYKESP